MAKPKLYRRLSDRCDARLRAEGVQLSPGQASRMLWLLDAAVPGSSNLNELATPIRVVIWSTGETVPYFCARIERVGGRLVVSVAGAPEQLEKTSEVDGLCLVWDENGRAITLNPLGRPDVLWSNNQ